MLFNSCIIFARSASLKFAAEAGGYGLGSAFLSSLLGPPNLYYAKTDEMEAGGRLRLLSDESTSFVSSTSSVYKP